MVFAYYNGEFGADKLENYILTPKNLGANSDFLHPDSNFKNSKHKINLSDKAKQHILYGDKTGGGHKFGVNKPCKSEFPKEWNDKKIITSIKRVAANDNTHWRKEDNGYFVSEMMEDGIKIRVVVGRKKQNIITAYPINVRRNYCPTNYNN